MTVIQENYKHEVSASKFLTSQGPDFVGDTGLEQDCHILAAVAIKISTHQPGARERHEASFDIHLTRLKDGASWRGFLYAVQERLRQIRGYGGITPQAAQTAIQKEQCPASRRATYNLEAIFQVVPNVN
jgi:hypothetical protein